MENIQEEIVKYNDDGLNFLKSQDVKEISNRTFIQEMELSKFLNEDFSGINKTKAMGFIQILQREYGIDLSSLKDRYLSYHSDSQTSTPTQKPSMIMEEVESEERKKGFFSFLFLIGAIGLMGYIVNKYDLLNFSTPSGIKTVEVIDKKDINEAKINLNQLTTPNKPEIVKEPKKEEKVVVSEVAEPTQTDKKELSLNDVLASSKPEKQEEKQEVETNTEQKVETTQNNNDIDLSQLNSDLAKDEASNTSETENTGVEATQDENSEATTAELYITPSSKVWIGTIELETLKKKDFLAPRGKRVDIDTSKNQLIMIGHKFVKLYLNGERVSFKRKGPIRFKYIDGELTEINRREFNKLAKGRQW